MSIFTQNSRIKHHRISGANQVFTVPSTEDFTDGSWTSVDLCDSEIGVNLNDKKAYIRTADQIQQLSTNLFVSDYSIETGDTEASVLEISQTTFPFRTIAVEVVATAWNSTGGFAGKYFASFRTTSDDIFQIGTTDALEQSDTFGSSTVTIQTLDTSKVAIIIFNDATDAVWDLNIRISRTI